MITDIVSSCVCFTGSQTALRVLQLVF